MSEQRQLRLGAFMRPVSIHTGAWRYPGGLPDANFNFGHIKRFAQTLERGKFDAFFMADHLAVLNMPMDALKRSARLTRCTAAVSAPRRAASAVAAAPGASSGTHLSQTRASSGGASSRSARSAA